MRHLNAIIALGACACADVAAPDVVQSGPVETVQIAHCWAEELTWVAVQSDGGPWTRVVPDAQHTFRVPLAKRGGIAWVRAEDPKYRETRVFYGTASELKAQLSNCFLMQSPWNKSVTGAVAGVADGTRAVVGLGSGRRRSHRGPTIRCSSTTGRAISSLSAPVTTSRGRLASSFAAP